MKVIELKKNFSLDEISEQISELKPSELHVWIADVSDPFYQNSDNKKKVSKKIISEYIDWNPKDFSFLKNENGKPYLSADVNEINLQFNISHSGDYLALAVAKNNSVGVDIEKHRDGTYFEKISKKYFTDLEREYIFSNGAANAERFFEIWTAKEAGVKSFGGSFFKDVACVQFDPFKKSVKFLGNQKNSKWLYYNEIKNYSLSVIIS